MTRIKTRQSNHTATPHYDQIYNVSHYDDYRSPRARRLAIEHDHKQHRKYRRGAVLTIVIVLALVITTTAVWTQQTSHDKQRALAIAQRQSPTTSITKKLPGEIAALSQQLSLPNDAILDDDLEPNNAQVAVTLIDLSNQNRGQVHYHDTTQWTAASTYKLFVALEENQQVENGTLTWNSPLNGDTLGDCLRQMILVSDNNCPQAWLQNYSSFSHLTATATAAGSRQTDFSLGNMRASANDLANLLEQLQRGALLNALNTKNLLNLMEQQRCRDGIPAGVRANLANGTSPVSTTVADKVGFADDYNGPILNDAAIVNSPKGSYVLVIMTNGYSWQFIANLSSWIDAQME